MIRPGEDLSDDCRELAGCMRSPYSAKPGSAVHRQQVADLLRTKQHVSAEAWSWMFPGRSFSYYQQTGYWVNPSPDNQAAKIEFLERLQAATTGIVVELSASAQHIAERYLVDLDKLTDSEKAALAIVTEPEPTGGAT